MKEWTREERYRILTDPQELRELHTQAAASPYRQIFHIQSVTGLLNDPNGFVRQGDRWHLFYQWCPWGAVHGLKHWYHVVSEDLVTWRNLGVCLLPDRGDGHDNKGAYSGSAMPVGEDLYLYYTGNHRDPDWTRRSYTCLAKLRRDGWTEKYPLPLFGPHPLYTEHQRDPKLIRREDGYYIVLGAQTQDHRGCALLYRSEDPLRGWTFAGELKVPGFEAFGDMWECPAIEHIGGSDVLLFCPQHLKLPGRGESDNHNVYIMGTMDWDSLTFTPDGPFHVLDFGFDSYAAACANYAPDPDHAVLIAWMGLPDVGYPTDEEDWAGCLTLPRELSVRGGKLIQQPVPGLKKLRGEKLPLDVNEAGCSALPRAAELEADCLSGDAELDLFTHADGTSGLSIRWSRADGCITMDRSGMDVRFNQDQGEARSHPLETGLSHLRIFIDHSSVEIFVNDGEAVFTSRVFPTENERFFRAKGELSLRLWSLKPAVTDDFVI